MCKMDVKECSKYVFLEILKEQNFSMKNETNAETSILEIKKSIFDFEIC